VFPAWKRLNDMTLFSGMIDYQPKSFPFRELAFETKEGRETVSAPSVPLNSAVYLRIMLIFCCPRYTCEKARVYWDGPLGCGHWRVLRQCSTEVWMMAQRWYVWIPLIQHDSSHISAVRKQYLAYLCAAFRPEFGYS